MQTFGFKSLEDNYLKIFRLSWAIALLFISAGPMLLISGAMDLSWPFWILVYISTWLLLYALLYWYSVHWFRAYSYSLEASGLRIHKGVFWQQQQMVPRNRVQHVDITSGPLERRYTLSKLVVHTAGTRNASVTLPGLLQEDATELRQELINTNQTEDTV